MPKKKALLPRGVRRTAAKRLARELGVDFHTFWQRVRQGSPVTPTGPGPFYGEHSKQHIRLALTASDADIAAAAERLLG